MWLFGNYSKLCFLTLELWPPNVKNWLIGKDPNAGKDWRQEEKGTTEDEMVGWYHQLDGHEFEQTLAVGDGQGSLACCSPWVAKSQTWLSNWTELCFLKCKEQEVSLRKLCSFSLGLVKEKWSFSLNNEI